jgi:putative MATE family efflux protein
MMGATPDVLALIRQYMTVWYVGMVFVTVPMVGNNAIRATGDTKIPGLIMIAAAGINICLDPLLIFGLAGFPRLELVGAALATVIARAMAMVLSLSILHFREKMIEFALPRIRNLWDSWKKVLYVGMPSAATNIMVPLSMGVIVRLVARFGTEAVAAVGAGVRVQAFAMIVTIALGASLIPFIGQNWGAGEFERVRRARHISNRFSFFWGLLCAAALLVTAVPIGRLFSDEPEVVNHIAGYLWIVPLSYGMLGISRLTAASFNAINRPLVSATITMIHMFVLYIPLAYVGSHLLGLKGLFVGIGLANVAAGAIALFVTAWARREEPEV